jgi:hypothetical protein
VVSFEFRSTQHCGLPRPAATGRRSRPIPDPISWRSASTTTGSLVRPTGRGCWQSGSIGLVRRDPVSGGLPTGAGHPRVAALMGDPLGAAEVKWSRSLMVLSSM